MAHALAKILTMRQSRLRLTLAASAVILLVAVIVAAGRDGSSLAPPPAATTVEPTPGDPLAYASARQAAFVARATAGESQVLFTKSPGGALATAARVAHWRGLIDTATRGTGIDPALLEAIVFVESAGRPDVVAGGDASAAAGLTQILASTGSSLLGMHIDLPRSRRVLSAIGNAGSPAQVARLLGQLAAADDRFAPARALAATVRYLELARRRFGRLDLAVASYHMGIGNLQDVLDDYDGGGSVSYAQLYFDTAPDRHVAAFRLLSSFGDQSSLYLWRVLGAIQVMRLYRSDRSALVRLATLQNAFPSTAEVLHPPDHTGSFSDASALSAAYAGRTLVPLPGDPARVGLRYAPSIGAGARRLGAPPALYRGLRPAAVALLAALGSRVQAVAGGSAQLTVQSAVQDQRYQRQSGVIDPPATTGYSFQIARQYSSPAQALAFQAVLDRWQALNLIAWVRWPTTIEVTVAGDAEQVTARGV